MDVTVEGTTSLIGATLGSRTDDFSFSTEELITRDLFDSDRSRSFSVGAGLGKGNNNGIFGPVSGVNGSFSTATREGTTFATLGQGDITIGGQTGEAIADQLAGINRDIENAQEITRDTSFSTGDLTLDTGALGRARENIDAIRTELEERQAAREVQRALEAAQRTVDEAEDRRVENADAVQGSLSILAELLLDEASLAFDPALRDTLQDIFENPGPDQYVRLRAALLKHESDQAKLTLESLERSIAETEQILRDLGVIADAATLRQVAINELNESLENFFSIGVFGKVLDTVVVTGQRLPAPEDRYADTPINEIPVPHGFEVVINGDGTVSIDGGLFTNSSPLTEEEFREWAATRGDIAPSSLEVVAAQHRNERLQRDVGTATGVGILAPFAIIGGLAIVPEVAAAGTTARVFIAVNQLRITEAGIFVAEFAAGDALGAAGLSGGLVLGAKATAELAEGTYRFLQIEGRLFNRAGQQVDEAGEIVQDGLRLATDGVDEAGNALVRVIGSAGDDLFTSARKLDDEFPELIDVNPHFLEGATNNNCVSCVNNAIKRLLGIDEGAVAEASRGAREVSDLKAAIGFGFDSTVANNVPNLEAKLLDIGEGAIATLDFLPPPGANNGHTIIGVVRNGVVRFVDPQTGSIVDINATAQFRASVTSADDLRDIFQRAESNGVIIP